MIPSRLKTTDIGSIIDQMVRLLLLPCSVPGQCRRDHWVRQRGLREKSSSSGVRNEKGFPNAQRVRSLPSSRPGGGNRTRGVQTVQEEHLLCQLLGLFLSPCIFILVTRPFITITWSNFLSSFSRRKFKKYVTYAM